MKKLIFLFLVFFLQFSGYCLKPLTSYPWKPCIRGLMYKEYDFRTADNYVLKAWFYPAQEALSDDSVKYYLNKKTEIRPYKINSAVKHPTTILCNGDAANMSYSSGIANKYCTNGYNVLTFDWRGFGESQTFPIDTNYLVYNEFLTDYDAAVDFVKTIPTVDTTKIGVFGYSTGAFLSYATAFKRKEIKAIVVRGIFTDYETTAKHLNELKPNDIWELPDKIDEFSPANTWSQFTKPIFLIVGENDKVTPKENSLKILANIHSSIRELWIVKNAEHGGVKGPESIDFPLFIKKTLRFFNENLNQ